MLADHLPPIMLVMIVLACSGILWVFAVRDTFATGRNIAGSHDDAMLVSLVFCWTTVEISMQRLLEEGAMVIFLIMFFLLLPNDFSDDFPFQSIYTLKHFTKSTIFFDDSKGWKSTQGGLSAIKQVTTDANNMGGFFVRKMGGAAAMAVHTQKLMPLLFHPLDARWILGHFRPLLWLACFSNIAIATFYGAYMSDFADAGADRLPQIFIAILSLETITMLYFLFVSRKVKRGPSIALQGGKTPKSVPSRIVTRTVCIVSTAMAIIAGRDLFYSGKIMGFIPRDDIYLEWTGAFLHSPPEGTPEADQYGISSSFHVGEKFLSQFLALHILLLCTYKFATAIGIRLGSDGSGMVKCRMIWKAQALGNALLLFLLRLFAPAANTASLDLRWHLMCVGYECFILGMYLPFAGEILSLLQYSDPCYLSSYIGLYGYF